MKVDNEKIISVIRSVGDDLIFYNLKSKFVVLNKDYVINKDESYIKYNKFNYGKYDLKENPIDLIVNYKRIDKLQRRIDKLNNIKKKF